MKLKSFTPENCVQRSSQNPVLSFAKGVFRFNRSACELIGLKEGDRVEILQDEENESDWYVVKKDIGFPLSAASKSGLVKGLTFCSIALRNQIIESVGYGYASGRMLIAGQPLIHEKKKLYAILTSGLQNPAEE